MTAETVDLPLVMRPPARMAKLAADHRGWVTPFFVKWVDGKPDHRIVDTQAYLTCVKNKLCFSCGQPLGSYVTFPIGPMCAVNLTSAEPPSHRDCAEWSIKVCPFLSRPHARRRDIDPEQHPDVGVAGVMIKRNPGVTLAWTTKRWGTKSDGNGGALFGFGEPTSVSAWRESRPATPDEVCDAIGSGLPILRDSVLAQTDLDVEVGIVQLAKDVGLAAIYLRELLPPVTEVLERWGPAVRPGADMPVAVEQPAWSP